jgi:transposase
MKAYSQDLRQRVLFAIDQGDSQAEVAEIFAISVSTIKRYLKARRETGQVLPKAIPGRRAVKGAALQQGLLAQLEAHPDATGEARCQMWEERTGIKVSTASISLDGAADGVAFELYIEQILAPSLHPGQIVILDKLSIHLGARVKQAIEAHGCRLLFLPAYSPDLSPIEEAFSKLKSVLRRAGGRTREALQETIATALDRISATDAHGWFTHCGFLPSRSTEQVQDLGTPL